MLATCLVLLALMPTTQSEPRVERLENGLTVAVVEDHALPLVSLQLWYRVGSAADGPARPGLCHVARTILEHRDDAALRLRAAGVRFESRTLPDACYFASVLPPNFLEYVLRIEGGRMQPLTATRAMVSAALAAASRDYGLEPDAPEKIARRRLLAAMFPDHPYKHPPAFVAAALADLSADELNRFLKRWCVASNATLLVIGDVSTLRVLELARQHFGELPWAQPPRAPQASTPETAHPRLSVAVKSSGITLAWLTPPAGLFENAAIDVLMHRLCNPIDGPLAKRLGDLTSAPPRWQHDSWRQGGMLVLEVDTSGPQARPRDLERVVREELQRAAVAVPSPVELNRARALVGRDIMLRRAAFSRRALRLGWYELVAGDLLLADFAELQVGSVAVMDIQAAAAELLGRRTVSIVRAGPEPPTTERVEEAGSGLLQPLCLASPTGSPGPTSQSAPAALEDLPSVWPLRSPATITRRELGSNVVVTVCRLAGLEPAEVRTLVSAPGAAATDWDALVAVGSRQRAPPQLRDYVSYHGLQLGATRDGLRSAGPSRYVPQMIELQAELVRYPDASGGAGGCAWESLSATERVEVLIVGDVLADQAFDAVRVAWGDWQASTGKRTPGADTRPARPPDGSRRNRDPIDWLLSLESSAAVADALQNGVRDPWDLRPRASDCGVLLPAEAQWPARPTTQRASP